MTRKTKKRELKEQTIKAVLIGLAVISFWRGAWGLMDMYLFPNNLLLSNLLSLVIGVGILWATHYVVKELM